MAYDGSQEHKKFRQEHILGNGYRLCPPYFLIAFKAFVLSEYKAMRFSCWLWVAVWCFFCWMLMVLISMPWIFVCFLIELLLLLLKCAAHLCLASLDTHVFCFPSCAMHICDDVRCKQNHQNQGGLKPSHWDTFCLLVCLFFYCIMIYFKPKPLSRLSTDSIATSLRPSFHWFYSAAEQSARWQDLDLPLTVTRLFNYLSPSQHFQGKQSGLSFKGLFL